ncbi:SAM-dependent methyltransferase [Streptomyces sp. NPDC102441]|uniref:SAM-dependent methyltransferase n=1 Tax=Streptomyces sp. NPDC102441 TaxID=3366176 RepID=UPI0038282AA5
MTTGTSRPPIDTGRPHSARVYDSLLGGKDNYPADRAVPQQLPAEAKAGACQNRAFMTRAWLAGEGVSQFLDFDHPVALSLLGLLHFLPDDQNPRARVRTLTAALPTGSYLVLSQGASDVNPERGEQGAAEYGKGGIRLALRTRAEFAGFFEGLDVVEPGLVTAPEWYRGTPAPRPEESGVYVAVARIP